MDDFKGGRGKRSGGGFGRGGAGGGRGGPRGEGAFSRKPRGEGGYKPREGGFERKPREGGEDRPRRSFGERKPYAPRGEGGFERKPREGGYKPREGGFERRPREGGEERPRRSFGERKPYAPRGEGGFERKPREGGYKPREGGFERRPREGGFERRPREGGFERKPREGGFDRPRKPYGERKEFGERKPYGEHREGGYERKTYARSSPPRAYGARDAAPRGPRREREEGGFRERTPKTTHWADKDPYSTAPGDDGWLVGKHAVTAAIVAGRRSVAEVWMAGDEAEVAAFTEQFPQVKVITKSRRDLDARFPDQVHQGIAAQVGNLPQPDLAEILAAGPRLIVALDQVTDPHNVGAVLRSCAAFGVAAVVATERRSAGVTPVVAKAAAGALEIVPVVDVTNLVTSLKAMQEAGYKVIGLAGESETSLDDVVKAAKAKDKMCVVLGSEGEGLRRLTRETCDVLVRIPMGNAVESLNVSVAAGVMLSRLYKA
jgi:23S rRNA (guanosine2251-2'-O)-methyltransferase